MTVSRGLWVPINGDIGTTDVEARLADAALFAENSPGVPRSGLLGAPALVVTGTGTMNYSIAPCKPVMARTVGEGVYRWSIDGTTTVPTIAAPSSNSRIDIIWTKQNDQAKGDPDNLAVVGVSSGVAAPTPAAPSIPAGALELARATVGALITGTSSASITQTFTHTALRGAPIPVRNDTERAALTGMAAGAAVRRLDGTPNYLEEWNGTAWKDTTAPRGLVARHMFNTTDGVGQVAAVISQSIPSFTFKGGRKYLIGVTHNLYVSNTDTVVLQSIGHCPTTDGASSVTGITFLMKTDFDANTTNRAYPGNFEAWYEPATDTTRQVKLHMVRIAGTGNFNIQRNAEAPSTLWIQDMGANI